MISVSSILPVVSPYILSQCTGLSIQIQPYVLGVTAGSVFLTILSYGFIPVLTSRIGSPKVITGLRKLRNALGRIGIVLVAIGGLYLTTIWLTYPECF